MRAPYEREAAKRPRRTSFGATVNPGQFLKDATGDRRFWVIPITDIDIGALLALPETWFVQLWAEAYIGWQENPQGFRLSREERRHLDELNRDYREMLPLEEEIREVLDFILPLEQWGRFSSTELGKQLFISSYQPGLAPKIGRVLAKLAREDVRIERTILDGVPRYRLPLKKIMEVK